jgi:voltage-dependent anion channel protein 2
VKKGGLYSLDVSSVYKYKNTTVDVKLDTESNVSDMEHLNLCIFSLWLIASVNMSHFCMILADLYYIDCVGRFAIHKACHFCEAA